MGVVLNCFVLGSKRTSVFGCTPDSLRTCSANSDCADLGDQRCDSARGKCVAIQQVCSFGTVCDPRNKICVTPAARFGFHLARRQDATQMLRSAYQADIRVWIDAHGGLTFQLMWLQRPEIYKFFRKC